MKKWTEKEIAFALTYSRRHSPFYIRSHICVANVFWGAGFNHEIDLLSISKAGYGTEIEIKISVSDLKRDSEKPHGHFDRRIKDLYFAGPAEMEGALIRHAPERAGVIAVELVGGYRCGSHNFYRCHTVKKPQSDKRAVKFSEKEIAALLRLGNMRFWTLLGDKFRYSEGGNNVKN